MKVQTQIASRDVVSFRMNVTDGEPSCPDLTLIIPAYNEESRLPGTLSLVREYLDSWGVNYRVLVADDGSEDHTSRITNHFGERFSTISLPRNRGKGATVRAAMLHATGRVLAFTDADLPFDLSALRQGYERICSHETEVVFGARDLAGAADLAPRKLSRKLASATFRWIASRLVSHQVTDTQCGLKLFSHNAARSIFSRLTIEGFAFDAEVIYLTHRLNLRFSRVPVTLVNEHSSTISLTRHAWPMLRDIIALRWSARHDFANLGSQTVELPPDSIPEQEIPDRIAA